MKLIRCALAATFVVAATVMAAPIPIKTQDALQVRAQDDGEHMTDGQVHLHRRISFAFIDNLGDLSFFRKQVNSAEAEPKYTSIKDVGRPPPSTTYNASGHYSGRKDSPGQPKN